MNWLKEKLQDWLDIDSKLEKDIYKEIICKSTQRITALEKLVKVGIDIHQKSPSWAVVCIEGKPEYIKFYGTDTNTIKEIKQFLSQFNKDNTIIDAPHPIKHFLREIK